MMKTVLFISFFFLTVCSFDFNETNGLLRSKKMKVATFNTMLLPFDTPAFYNIIEDSLPRDLDVLFLQEVWNELVGDRLIAALKKHYPYNFRKSFPNRSAGCAADGYYFVNLFFQCFTSNGFAYEDIFTADIPLACNQILLGGLAQQPQIDPRMECFSCMSNFAGELTYGEATTQCFLQKGKYNIFNGNNGLLVLSKHKIENFRAFEFHTFLNARANLYARIGGVNFGFIHATFDYIGDKLGDQNFPIRILQDSSTDQVNHAIHESVDVLLGDFNSGPDYFPSAYNQALTYFKCTPNAATFCTTDMVAKDIFNICGGQNFVNIHIDHICFKKEKKWSFHETSIFNFGPSFLASDHSGVRTELKLKR